MDSRRYRLVACVFAAAMTSACASQREYIYRPSTAQIADMGGYPTAVYAVPPEKPVGETRVMSSGVVVLKGPQGGPQPTLHVRIMVANNSGERPLVLDTRSQFIEIGGVEQRANYAQVDSGPMPQVQVPRGQRRVVDFYFPAPLNARSSDHVPSFDVKWQLRTAERDVADRTPFARQETRYAPDPDVQMTFVAGWGWWYNPFWGPWWWNRPSYVYGPGYYGGGNRRYTSSGRGADPSSSRYNAAPPPASAPPPPPSSPPPPPSAPPPPSQ